MAVIYLIVRMECTEEEIKSCMVQKIQELAKKLEPGLELVKKSCEAKFPGLSVEWNPIDPGIVDYEEEDEGIWKALYWLHITTTSPNGSPEIEFKITEYDRWKEMGKPTNQEVAEYLHEADWSLIKPFCKNDDESIDVEFNSIEVYFQNSKDCNYHFNQKNTWL